MIMPFSVRESCHLICNRLRLGMEVYRAKTLMIQSIGVSGENLAAGEASRRNIDTHNRHLRLKACLDYAPGTLHSFAVSL